ncbi:hypothetical protein J3R83DRAFT_10914 [Lanmaoa asiatica]|nr:hypothetical protein J3R83DRAFT_10914 [Lanmaoa asiatica]
MIQTVRQYTAEWRVRDSEIPLTPRELDTLIRTDLLVGKWGDVFVEEFAGNLFSDRLFEDIAADCTDVTVPLLEHHFYNPDQEGKKTGFNLLNYEYWILGDRRFLLSRKRTSNVGDLVTRWRSSMVRASFDWSDNPADIMIASAAQIWAEREERTLAQQDAINQWQKKHPLPKGAKDALDFSQGLRQLTLSEAWSKSNTQSDSHEP